MERPAAAQAAGAASVANSSAPSVVPLALGQVDKVAKAALPEGARLSKECRVALHKAATLTVLMLGTLADEARIGAKRGKTVRQTLTGQDVAAAIADAGLQSLVSAGDDISAKKRKK